MVDNRAAGFYGIGGSFNFKSGDISGTTANLQDDKMGQGNEYSRQEKKEEESTQENKMQFTDRSAQLRATLSSLAMINVAGVIKNKNIKQKNEDKKMSYEKEFYEKTKKRRKNMKSGTLFVGKDLMDDSEEESEKE